MGGGTGGGAVGSETFPAVLSDGNPGAGGVIPEGMLGFVATYGSGKAVGVARDGLIILSLP